MRRAVCPGSFDPVTLGHLDIIGRASDLYDEVVVAVGMNAAKKRMFSLEERTAMLQEATAQYGNVVVDSFDGLIVDFCKARSIQVIVKGLRAISDYLYETEMAQLNRNEEPEVESFYLIASPEYSFLSSSGIKDMATFGGDISRYVPPRVARRLQEELTRPRTTG